MDKVDILGVRVSNISLEEASEKIVKWLSEPGKKYVVTPNPEFIIQSQRDKEFQKILNSADLAIPDGIGLLWANKMLKERVTGVDLMDRLCQLASENGFSVALLGGKTGSAEKTARELVKKYPSLKVSFATSDIRVDSDGKTRNPHFFASALPKTDLLFVALGQGKQEKWIIKNMSNLKIKVAMGVGGAFDYLSGNVSRAPKLVRNLGLEWLFRLLIEPWRIKRQFSLLKFIYLVMIK